MLVRFVVRNFSTSSRPACGRPPQAAVLGRRTTAGLGDRTRRTVAECACLAWLVHRPPHEHTDRSMPDNLALAKRILDGWNQGDATAVLALAPPDVEIVTPGCVGRGPEAVRQCVDKQTQPHAVMHIVLDQLLEAGDRVVVLARRQMRWRETGELADDTPLAALLTF